MTLTAIYERFAASPNPLNLTDNASLHYVPTLTTFDEQAPIVKHLQSQSRTVVRIKSQKTISAIEGPNAVAIEFETTLEFISGGGAYLPGLDNLIADKIATLPTVSPYRRCCNSILTPADAHSLLRSRPKDQTDSHLMGSSLFAQADGCHRFQRSSMASL